MKRYFDFPDEKTTLAVGVKVGSAAAIATPEAIAKHFSQRGAVREIELAEYARLTKHYTESNAAREDATDAD